MNGSNQIDIHHLLETGVLEGVFPGAVLVASHKGEIAFFEKAGWRSLLPERAPLSTETFFDLASLTKPLATTLAAMKLVDRGALSLDASLQDLLSVPLPRDKRAITPGLLLAHAGGWVDWVGFYKTLWSFPPHKRRDALHQRLLTLPLAYEPGKGTLYSDLGFMMLQWVIEERADQLLPRFTKESIYAPLDLKEVFFPRFEQRPPLSEERFAATEACPWRGRVLVGEVHDENAFALGGYAGHAGLFGTAREVHGLARVLMDHFHGKRDDLFQAETVRRFFTRQGVTRDSTWALGWDTPSPRNSSAGEHFSHHSVGHLGFTGTSLWMDLEKEVIVVLLTNRVHPTRDNVTIRTFRPALHNRVMEALGLV